MKNKDKNLLKCFLKNRKVQIFAACILLAGVGFLCIKAIKNSSSGETGYRETTVVYGDLTVGVTESGTIDIGTIEQTFDLDMSQLTRVSTSNSNSSSGSSGMSSMGGNMGGMGDMGGFSGGNIGGGSSAGGSSSSGNMFGQMFDMSGSAGGNTSGGNSSSLVIDSVSVSVGQEISVGDVLLTLNSDSLDELKSELEKNVEKASADLEALIADQKLSQITAEYTLSNALKDGDYAATEKSDTIASLKKDVTDAETNLTEAKNTLARYKEQLETAKEDYNAAVVIMNQEVWSRDNIDKTANTYLYTYYFNNAQTATSNVESLKSKVEQLESRIESAQSSVTRCETNLAKAKRAYDTGVLSAQETYDLRMLAYETAQETYDITVSYLEKNLKQQQETYDETLAKWNEFTSYVDGENILSEYKGVVTAVSLAAGDSLTTGAVVVTLYDADAITMTVSVSEDDMTDIELGGLANINLTAYTDPFVATITEISDATSDSSGNTTRDVTVTLSGDVSKLFQDMTGEVTFITKQSAEVLYVSNRAIIRENGQSYVKVKESNGNIKKVKVVTGFSDGVNVEIVDGLTEGQTVIIEKGEA